jgi:hypothetical protein
VPPGGIVYGVDGRLSSPAVDRRAHRLSNRLRSSAEEHWATARVQRFDSSRGLSTDTVDCREFLPAVNGRFHTTNGISILVFAL